MAFASATRLSDDGFVSENKSISTMLLPIPNPTLLATAASSSRSWLSGSVAIVEGMLKSSRDPSSDPPNAPFTAVFAAFDVMIVGPFHSGCGIFPMIPQCPVPPLAHSQIPRRGVVSSVPPFAFPPLSPVLPEQLSRSWRDSASELGRLSPWAGGDWCSSAGLGMSFSGSVTRRNLFFCSFGLGGVAVAFSVDISTVEDAGLVSRRRTGLTLIPSCRRACCG